MKYFDSPLQKSEIESLKAEFGDYVKVTSDLANNRIVVGCELHADGEKLLLEKGGKSDDIWGGGFNFKSKLSDTTAVLNFRPRLGNDTMDILDLGRRNKFLDLVNNFFREYLDNGQK